MNSLIFSQNPRMWGKSHQPTVHSNDNQLKIAQARNSQLKVAWISDKQLKLVQVIDS